jgi:hypothetical protein
VFVPGEAIEAAAMVEDHDGISAGLVDGGGLLQEVIEAAGCGRGLPQLP